MWRLFVVLLRVPVAIVISPVLIIFHVGFFLLAVVFAIGWSLFSPFVLIWSLLLNDKNVWYSYWDEYKGMYNNSKEDFDGAYTGLFKWALGIK